jgi:ATP-dependent Lon protease
VLIPEQNVKDLAEIPDNVKNKLEIVPVRWIDKVLEIALERQPMPLVETPPVEAVAAAAAKVDGQGEVVKH